MVTESEKRILFVDHSIAVSRCFRQFLKDTNYVILRVDSGDVYNSIEVFKPHVVLTRELHPRRKGTDLISSLIKRGISTPFILVTSYDSNQIEQTAKESGASALVYLPSNKDAFIKTLDEVTQHETIDEMFAELVDSN